MKRIFLLLSLAFVYLLALLQTVFAENSYAVLVGVSAYKNVGVIKGLQDLEHAHTDAQKMRDLLIKYYRFPVRNIQLLLNKQATKKNILQAMESLVRKTKQGDRVVFYFAGHGSQVPNTSGDEADKLDETIVPYDADVTAKSHIIDDWMADWIKRMIKKTNKLTMIFDSCHSGGMTRGGYWGDQHQLRIRYWPNPAAEQHINQMQKQKITARNIKFGGNFVINRGDLKPHHSGYVFLAASKSNETAKEHSLFGGVFTYWLVHHAKAMIGKPISKVHDKVKTSVTISVQEQTPVIEGKASANFLFHDTAPPPLKPPWQQAKFRTCEGDFCAALWGNIGEYDTSIVHTRYRIRRDFIYLYLHVTARCYVILISHGTSGRKFLLSPNTWSRLGELQARKVYRWPPRKAKRFNLEIFGPPGEERIEMIAFRNKIAVDQLSFLADNNNIALILSDEQLQQIYDLYRRQQRKKQAISVSFQLQVHN